MLYPLILTIRVEQVIYPIQRRAQQPNTLATREA